MEGVGMENYNSYRTSTSNRTPNNNVSVTNFAPYTKATKTANDQVALSTADNKRVEKYNHRAGRVFTGSVERVMKWHRLYSHFCYYEVIASVIALQESPVRMQRVMLLRDRKGPILQVAYYCNDRINITDFFVGQTLRCLGHMIAASTLHALSIRAATDEELSTLQRIAYVCDHTIARAIS